MAPALAPGDRLLVMPLGRPRVGDIVAVPDPRDPGRMLVKRVVAADSRRRLLSVEGDNRTASTDSRTFGPVSCDDVLGRAVYRYSPSSRAGRVRRAVQRSAGGAERSAGGAERYDQRE
jgi:nickel-type superoxide dismutase maturation protease